MAIPVLAPSTKTEVGKFYMVPCVFVSPPHRSLWHPRDGWVPVLGPKHSDKEFLNFEWEHFHIDWRFVGRRNYEDAAGGLSRFAQGRVLTSAQGYYKLPDAGTLRRRVCRRAMPDFPAAGGRVANLVDIPGDVGRHARPWRHMEVAQAFVCNKLKPGNICPHRGIDLTPFIKEDGTVICPGHGLRWDTATGNLLPHHASAA